MKIEFIGAQGTGKTTVADQLTGFGIPVIDNVIRNLVKEQGIKINQQGTIEGQEAIFRAYEHALDEYMDFISTRSLFDVVAFTQYLYVHGRIEDPYDVVRQVDRLVTYLHNNKDVVYVYFPIEFDPVDDGVRSTDKKYQKEIDKIMVEILKNTKTPYYTIHGTVEERVKFMNDLIDNIETYGVKNNQVLTSKKK